MINYSGSANKKEGAILFGTFFIFWLFGSPIFNFSGLFFKFDPKVDPNCFG